MPRTCMLHADVQYVREYYKNEKQTTAVRSTKNVFLIISLRWMGRSSAPLVFCVEVHESFRGSFHRFHGSFHSLHENFHRFHGSFRGIFHGKQSRKLSGFHESFHGSFHESSGSFHGSNFHESFHESFHEGLGVGLSSVKASVKASV